MPAPHVLVGGHRRHPGLHPLPAGRHLQLRPVRRASWPRRSGTSPRRAAANPLAGAVRLGRRRRRPDPGDAGQGAPARADLEGSPAVRIGHARRSSSPTAEAEYPNAAGLVGRAVPGDPPRHLHHRRRGPSRATGAASTCCARPSCGRPRPPCAPGWRTPYEELRPASGGRCCCTSSTTSCRARRSPGCTARPRRTTPRVGARAGGDHRRARWRALAGDGDGGRSSPTPAPYARGRRAGLRRPAPSRSEPGTVERRARRRRAACSTTALLRVAVDERRAAHLGRTTSAPSREVLAAGRRRRTCSSCTPTPRPVGRLGHRRALPRHGTRPDATSTSVDRVETGRGAVSVRVVRGVRRRPRITQVDQPAPPARRRSTSTPRSTGTSGRSCSSWPSRSTCTPTGPPPRSSSGTSPADPRQHLAGTRPGSRLRAPLGARRRAGLRRRGRQRLDVRPRRHPRPPGRTAAPRTTVRLSLLRAPRIPDPQTDQGAHRLRVRAAVGRRRSPTPSPRATGSTCRCGRCAGRRRRRAAGDRGRPGRGRRGGQAGRGPQRRRGGAAVRVARRPGHGRDQQRLRTRPAWSRPTCWRARWRSRWPCADGARLTLRPFQIVTLRIGRRHRRLTSD